MKPNLLGTSALARVNTTCMGMFDNWMGGGGDKKKEDTAATGAAVKPKFDPETGKPVVASAGDGTGGDNGDGTDDDLVSKLWKDEKAAAGADDGKGTTQQQQQQTQTDDAKLVSDHLKAQGLDPIELSDEQLAEGLTGDNLKAFIAQVNAKIPQAYMKAMSNSRTMMQAEITKAVETAVGQTKSLMVDDKARTALRAALPWTADDALGPIAESVLKRFMGKGADITKAVEMTKKFYEYQQKKIDPDYVPNTNSGGMGRGRSPQNPGGDQDFLAMLRGNDLPKR